jgi:hypothetical protein
MLDEHGEELGEPITQDLPGLGAAGLVDLAADQLMFDQIAAVLVANEDLAQQAKVNTMGNYKFGVETAFLHAIHDRRVRNDGIFTSVLDDEEFAEAVKAALIAKVDERQQVTSTLGA